MYLHDKLDWHLSRAEARVEAHPDDAAARVQLAQIALSKAWFHDGGEAWFNTSLTHARRVLQADPGSPDALVIAGSALVGLDRPEPALRYLDEAQKRAAERPDLLLALGRLHWSLGERHQAVRALEQACRMAPKSWECHAWLGQVLAERAEDLNHPPRLHERSRFHVTRALELGTSSAYNGPLIHLLAVSCLQSERYEDAHKLFTRLQGIDEFRSRAEFYLGLVAFHLHKYKNAVLHLRRRLNDRPDDPRVHARLAMCFLQLGETDKARESCNRALAADPDHPGAQWTLACAMLEDGQTDDAVKGLRDILAAAPDHMPAFAELVGVRKRAKDRRWLVSALTTEVGHFDKLPLSEIRGRSKGNGTISISPRSVTRRRIDVIINALADLGDRPVEAVIGSMDLATDEGLRFHLWEQAMGLLAERRGHRATRAARRAADQYGALAGRALLAVARHIPEQSIVHGLDLSEEDLRRAAVERHGSAHDLAAHRGHVEQERQQARAWQASLLLALGCRGDKGARNLLVRWASEADPEMSHVANTALTLMGDGVAASATRSYASKNGALPQAERFLRAIPRNRRPEPPQVVTDDSTSCTTCGRVVPEAKWLYATTDAAACDHCLQELARGRQELLSDDLGCACRLCGRDGLTSSGVFVLRATPICATCLDNGLGWAERDVVDRYLSTVRAAPA
jgi:tetratricopeptide (TPR) repeat protein